MSEAAEILRAVLTDHDTSTTEKINAAKALDAIERRAGALTDGDLSSMTLADIDAEIAHVRALIASQGVEKKGKLVPTARE